MTAIPQEWIDVGARALGTDAGCTADFDTLQRLYGWEAEAVLTAVLPLIREAIAQQIEARRQERMASDWASLDESMEDHEAGMEFAFRIAARIAREGAL